jgi:hypothetical protein
VIVVFDHVESTNPAFAKTWFLHTVEIPRIDGKVALVTNTTRVPITGNSKPQAGDTWLQYGGKMFLETILPVDSKVQFVGGNGKEFWVDGANRTTDIREVDRLTEPGTGRIEVTPGRPAATDFFLHVLSPTAANDPAGLPATVLLEQEKGVGLVVADHVLLLPTETGVRSRVAYRVDRAGSLLHVVMGLPARARCRITRSKTALEAAQASENGLLLFRASGGADFEVSATAP